MKFILGKKLNMAQVFTADGVRIPVTVIEAGPCKAVAVKNPPKDEVVSVQLGFGSKKKLNKPQAGHQKGEKFQYLREFRLRNGDAEFKVGQSIPVSIFAAGEYVDVIGVMKGRGFTGAMKRHGFHGMPATHGHNHPRAVGSIGSRFPQHTLKGTRMAGRMGGHNVTVKNLLVVEVDPDKNLLWLKGAVPGTRNGLVKIIATGKKAEALKLYAGTSSNQEEVSKEKGSEAK